MGPAAIANWRYEFKDIEGGCQVTESWSDHRKRWMRALGRSVGVHDGAHAKGEMAATLASLAHVGRRLRQYRGLRELVPRPETFALL